MENLSPSKLEHQVKVQLSSLADNKPPKLEKQLKPKKQISKRSAHGCVIISVGGLSVYKLIF